LLGICGSGGAGLEGVSQVMLIEQLDAGGPSSSSSSSSSCRLMAASVGVDVTRLL